VNYALGHGGRDDVATPRRVDFTDVVLENADEEKNDTTGGFRDDAISVSCSKFHSVVAFRDGSVFAWGHGRGGRLGVMDAGVHDGDVAALRPTEVFFPEPPGTSFVSVSFKKDSSFLPSRTHFVTRVAAGKHHTLATTFGGALFSWGRAADGRLGYDVRDCDVQDDAGGAYQRTPRLVLGALRDAFVVDVAAANRHSAATTRAGEVFAFGSNAYGQLGRRPKTAFSFGSREGEPSRGSPSASPKQRDAHAFLGGSSPADAADVAHPARDCESREWSPAAADALKPLGRVFVGVSASKRHTVVLDATGAVYQFGQGDYSPRRVALKEDERSSSSSSAAAAAAAEVAAGANVSLARARDGSVWGWFSKDPHLRAFRVAGFGAGDDTDAVSVAACKTACAVVTGAGDAYLFDAPEYPGGEKQNESTWFRAPAFFFRRAEGVRRVDFIRLGELHALATQALTRASTGSASRRKVGEKARGARAKTTPVDQNQKAFPTFSDSAFSFAADRLAGGGLLDDAELSDSSEAGSDSDSSVNESHHDALTSASDDSDVSSVASRFGVFFGADEEATAESLVESPPSDARRRATRDTKPRRSSRDATKTKGRAFVVPSLRSLAQDSLAKSSCDARSVFELLAFAESVGADRLANHCRTFFVENADAVLAERGVDALAGVPAETLKILEARSAEIEPEPVRRDQADEAFILEAVRNGLVVRRGDAAVERSSDERATRLLKSTRVSGDASSTPDDDSNAVAAAVDRFRSARARVPAEDAVGRTNANGATGATEENENANGSLSWLEARGVRGVAKEPPRSPTPRSFSSRRSFVLGGIDTAGHTVHTSSRSRRSAADAAASRVARGGLSLFLSGALEEAVERGGGDAAVAAAAAARDAARRAPPRGWGVPGDGPGDVPGDGDDRPGSGSRVPWSRHERAFAPRDRRRAGARGSRGGGARPGIRRHRRARRRFDEERARRRRKTRRVRARLGAGACGGARRRDGGVSRGAGEPVARRVRRPRRDTTRGVSGRDRERVVGRKAFRFARGAKFFGAR
jgi:hypothetical protein